MNTKTRFVALHKLPHSNWRLLSFGVWCIVLDYHILHNFTTYPIYFLLKTLTIVAFILIYWSDRIDVVTQIGKFMISNFKYLLYVCGIKDVIIQGPTFLTTGEWCRRFSIISPASFTPRSKKFILKFWQL